MRILPATVGILLFAAPTANAGIFTPTYTETVGGINSQIGEVMKARGLSGSDTSNAVTAALAVDPGGTEHLSPPSSFAPFIPSEVQAQAPTLPWLRDVSAPTPVNATIATLLWQADLEHPSSVDLASPKLPWARRWGSRSEIAVENATVPWARRWESRSEVDVENATLPWSLAFGHY